jgi:hypothetical protein
MEIESARRAGAEPAMTHPGASMASSLQLVAQTRTVIRC